MSETTAHYSWKYYRLLKILGQDAQEKNNIYLALALQYVKNFFIGVGTCTDTCTNVIIHLLLHL